MKQLTFRTLGPLELRHGGHVITLTGQQRALLAVLLLDANQAVPTDRLSEALWGERLPAAAAGRVRTLVADLRRVCGADRIVTVSRGYLARVLPGELDADVFATMIDDARRAQAEGRLEDARALFDAALELWCGEPAQELLGPSVCFKVSRLREAWRAAMDERAEVKLALGLYTEVISEMRHLAAECPLRERPQALLMLALLRDGRRAEALEVYRDTHARFIEELGLEPSAELRDLNQRLLTEEPGSLVPVSAPVAWRSPCLLPADTADFVGRGAETESIIARLRGETTAPPIAVVWGKPGMGKTTLAVHVAHALRSRYPDGQLFTRLRCAATREPREPGAVLAEFLRVLGVDRVDIPESTDERAAIYRDRIADRRLLVVLDDALNEAQVELLLPGTPACVVLVTSRGPLLGLPGSCAVRLDVLPDPDARVLLGNAAGHERVNADPVAIGDLLDDCGGSPLALRIAGGRLAMRPPN